MKLSVALLTLFLLPTPAIAGHGHRQIHYESHCYKNIEKYIHHALLKTEKCILKQPHDVDIEKSSKQEEKDKKERQRQYEKLKKEFG